MGVNDRIENMQIGPRYAARNEPNRYPSLVSTPIRPEMFETFI